MPDGFSLRFITEAMDAATRDVAKLDGAAHRAVMWSLREAGRQVKREARKRTRVYKGTGRTVKVTTGARGQNGKREYGKQIGVVPGLLRSSITSPKRLNRVGVHAWELKVGPRGGHAHLYAQKIENLDHYMAQAKDVVQPKVRDIHEKAMRRAIARYGP